MSDPVPPGARASPSTARNRDPILAILRVRLPDRGLVLEIASGAGEHAVHAARALPQVTWQPTDLDAEALTSIDAWRDHAGLPNLQPALRVDAAAPETWPVNHADAIVAINMIHIAPWTATEGLLSGAERILPTGGLLYLYGPYIDPAVETAASNLAFDASLKLRNPDWGLRRLDEVVALARTHGLELAERVEMPANNLSLVFRKT